MVRTPQPGRANRKKVQRWLRAHPRAKVPAEEILDTIYDMCDSSKEVQHWVNEARWLVDYYLRVFPDKEIGNWSEFMWDGAYVAGRLGNPDPTNPKYLILPARAEIEAWVAKNGGIVPLPKLPPALR